MDAQEWSSFMHSGFAEDNKDKLKFDLRESERSGKRAKHQTLDWSTFTSAGFGGRETYVDSDLSFDSIAESVASLQDEKKDLNARLRKTEKQLPKFPFDITPREERPILVDELFFETWADVLVASGWAKEEIKESSWVLCQYRARPIGRPTKEDSTGDGRTEDMWVLFEESVPAEYRQELLDSMVSLSSTAAEDALLMLGTEQEVEASVLLAVKTAASKACQIRRSTS